jgi:GT2 family glycosyltransferase
MDKEKKNPLTHTNKETMPPQINTIKETVAAVVVTYNRKEFLVECLEALLRQEPPIDAIILVDNKSTPDTPAFLNKKGFLKELPPEETTSAWESISCHPDFPEIPITTILLPENIGGAGGFHEGVKRAFEAGFDWLWLMDDDVEPQKGCLEGLLKYKNISQCIHPSKIFSDGIAYEWEGYVSLVTGQRVFLHDISFKEGKEYCETNTGCFEGMLVHREIVSKIGFPDKRFFIAGDDSTYGFLAHFHTKVLYTRDPIIHKKLSSIPQPLSDRSIYYGMRNTFLRIRYINERVKKHRSIRNIFILVKASDYFLNILKSPNPKTPSLKTLFRALKDGFTGQYGKRF